MKKLLIASAALAMVAGTAQAQSVTLYGSLDTGYTDAAVKVTTQATGRTVSTTNAGVSQSNDVSSRWGMRGTEDLGGGLKANFNVESSLGSGNNGQVGINGNTVAGGGYANTTVNTNQIGNRALWVGVSTSGGLEVRAGVQNQFSRDINLGFSANGGTNIVGDHVSGDTNLVARHNAIQITQTMGGLKFGAALTGRTTEVTNVADVDVGKGYEGMVMYTAGPFSIAGSMRKVDNSTAVVTAATKQAAANTLIGNTAATQYAIGEFADTAATNVKTELNSIGASYNFGVVKAFASYATLDTQDKIAAGARKAQREVTSLGVNGMMGKTELFFTYSMGETTAAPVGAVSRDIDGYVLGARYNLSKRTHLYAIYGTSEVDAGDAAIATTSTKTTQYAVGLNHKF